ncbi:hypothetical protein RchiOBHm_Chr7g0189231 [Rosa chinensis]|uniref:Uncharacterized protein n=1 Tax=Rosa chinensis TaxID=74649 RepID=A0A2P6P4Q2_ROSCH|nr:hypothetical protein RchiOBHm_Chr7g0189231 [Rosa chinensis]
MELESERNRRLEREVGRGYVGGEDGKSGVRMGCAATTVGLVRIENDGIYVWREERIGGCCFRN